MIEIGRLCVKIAGRDAGKKCVIVDVLDGSFVLIDGETRRRKCNALHLEPLDQVLKLDKGASHEAVAKAFKELGVTLVVKKSKAKPSAQKSEPKAKKTVQKK